MPSINASALVRPQPRRRRHVLHLGVSELAVEDSIGNKPGCGDRANRSRFLYWAPFVLLLHHVFIGSRGGPQFPFRMEAGFLHCSLPDQDEVDYYLGPVWSRAGEEVHSSPGLKDRFGLELADRPDRPLYDLWAIRKSRRAARRPPRRMPRHAAKIDHRSREVNGGDLTRLEPVDPFDRHVE